MAKNNKGNNNFTKRTSNIVKQSNKPVVDKENHVIIFRGSKSISDLAKELSVSPTEVIKFLFLEGKMVNINSVLDACKVIARVDVVSAIGIKDSNLAKKLKENIEREGDVDGKKQ